MIGNKVCFFQTLDSTNTFMKDHINDFKHGDMVCAKIQNKGRGRRNRTWVSQEGNLHTSFLLDTKVHPYTPFEVVMRTSLAIVALLKEFGITAMIKYPNDIVIGKRKMAGILIEKVDSYYIVGVGVNVTFSDTDTYEFPITSIFLETKKLQDYRDVLSALIHGYNHLLDYSNEQIYQLYKGYSIVLDQKIEYQGAEFHIDDISLNGELILKNNEKTMKIVLNEVSLKEFYSD